MEENKNDIDELVKSIDSSFKEMSLKDIVAAHENYFGADGIDFGEDENDNLKEYILKDAVEDKETDSIQADLLEKNSVEKVSAEKQSKSEETDIVESKAQSGEMDEVEVSHNAISDAERKKKARQNRVQSAGNVGNWFQTFCYMRIPLIGFIYILVLAFSKKTPDHKKEFARGYILYRLLVWILAIVLLYCLYKVGLGFVDGMLSFIKA